MNEPRTLVIRILYSALIVGLMLFAPWYVTLCIVIIGFLLFQGWYEMAALALFYDALYNTQPLLSVGLFGFALCFIFISDTIRISLRTVDNGKLHFK